MNTRRVSNPMDKGACSSIHYKYNGRNSNMVSGVTMYIIGYIILMCVRVVQNELPLRHIL